MALNLFGDLNKMVTFTKPEQMQAAIDDYFESCWDIIEVKKGEGESDDVAQTYDARGAVVGVVFAITTNILLAVRG